jgi:hypothetical protein
MDGREPAYVRKISKQDLTDIFDVFFVKNELI